MMEQVQETPGGVIDGSNTTFVLSQVPLAGTLQFFKNGVLQLLVQDYTISGYTITTTTPPLITPPPADTLYAVYFA